MNPEMAVPGVMPTAPPFNQQPVHLYKQSMALLKLMQFCEALNSNLEQKSEIEFWRRVIGEFFVDTGVLKYTVNSGKERRTWELPAAILPRFYRTFIVSGVQRIQIHLEDSRPFQPNPMGFVVDCPRASVSYYMGKDNFVTSSGSLRVIFNNRLKIELLEQSTNDHNEFISREAVIALLESSPEAKSIPHSKLGPFGMTESVMRFLQISETMTQMRDLMSQSAAPNSGGPLKTFETLHKINSRSFQQQQMQLAHQQHLQQQQQQLKQQLAKQNSEKDDSDPNKNSIKQEVIENGQEFPMPSPANGQQPMEGVNEQMMAMNAARVSPSMVHNNAKAYPHFLNPGNLPTTTVAGGPANSSAAAAAAAVAAGVGNPDMAQSPAMNPAMHPGAHMNNPGSRPSPRLGNKRRRPSTKEESIEPQNMRHSPKMAKK